ncbi:MAG TPA: Fur family transcriptional regulator [Anaerolineae bacterium]|nr:Fur family transcriptional regulator [Anaerolineae bacterium]HQK12961.1 Fur family transcriptional regulator [Anaerolineae bacterium]
MSCQEHFVRQLHERGLRLTPQRELVLKVMHQLEAPATAEEIYARVHALSASVDISTVYRTLDLFREFNLVATFDPGDGIRRYEHLGVEAPHHHLVCRACGKVSQVALEELQPLIAHLAATSGFVADTVALTISGLCAACYARDCCHQIEQIPL